MSTALNPSASGLELPGVALQSRPGPVRRILIVDDDPTTREDHSSVLAHSGYAVDAAPDGDAAWHALNQETYDLLITNNAQPDFTGLHLLKKLRASRMVIPVITAAASFPTADSTYAPWLQPAATLIKPYSVAELLGAVKHVLGENDSPPAMPPAEKLAIRPMSPHLSILASFRQPA